MESANRRLRIKPDFEEEAADGDDEADMDGNKLIDMHEFVK